MKGAALQQQIASISHAVADRLGSSYEVMVVLGSGLLSFTEKIESRTAIRYADIPGFPVSTVKGHAGEVVSGTIAGRRVLCFAGRFHYYEGYDMTTVTIPVRIAGMLGVRTALLTNAAGGISEALHIGDLMVIEDHLDLLAADSPLRGLPDGTFGSKFVNMYTAYDPGLATLLKTTGRKQSLPVSSGVYAALAGPQYETRAEIRMLRILGADAVGMSTVPEVIVANQMGMRVGAVSVITDLATETTTELSHAEVVAAAQRADGNLAELLAGAIKEASL